MGNIGTGRALRRGVALGLAAVAAWGISLTADLGDMGRELAGLEGEPALAASLLAAQMGELPGGEGRLTGWGRLLLNSSTLLKQGEGAVLARRSPSQSLLSSLAFATSFTMYRIATNSSAATGQIKAVYLQLSVYRPTPRNSAVTRHQYTAGKKDVFLWSAFSSTV